MSHFNKRRKHYKGEVVEQSAHIFKRRKNLKRKLDCFSQIYKGKEEKRKRVVVHNRCCLVVHVPVCKMQPRAGFCVQVIIPATWEASEGGSGVQCQPEQLSGLKIKIKRAVVQFNGKTLAQDAYVLGSIPSTTKQQKISTKVIFICLHRQFIHKN